MPRERSRGRRDHQKGFYIFNLFSKNISAIISFQVLDILYQTEDGFAVPEEEEGVPPPPEGEEEY